MGMIRRFQAKRAKYSNFCIIKTTNAILSHSGIVSQEALLLQRDCATRLSVEILQQQNIPFVN